MCLRRALMKCLQTPLPPSSRPAITWYSLCPVVGPAGANTRRVLRARSSVVFVGPRVGLYLRKHTSLNVLFSLLARLTRSFSGHIVGLIRYALPVLWMTSCFL